MRGEQASEPWDEFQDWCEKNALPWRDSPGPALARHLLKLGARPQDSGSLKPPSPRILRFHLEAIAEGFRELGLEDPSGHPDIQAVIKRLEDAELPTDASGEASDLGSDALDMEFVHVAASQQENPGLPPSESSPRVLNSEAQLVPLEAASELPLILAGHETPAVRVAVEGFYRSVHTMFEAWIARRQSFHTQRAYRRDVLDFVEFLGVPTTRMVVGSKEVTTIEPGSAWSMLKVTVPQVQAWRDYLSQERDAAPNTLNRRVSSVSGFYRFMREAAAEARLPITVPNPAHSQFISREMQEAVSPTEALSATRARQLMALPEGESVLAHRDRALLKFFLYTGARIGTGCRLLVEDFIDDEEDPRVRIQEKGKGKSKRAVGINAIAADALREYLQVAGLVSGPFFRSRKASRSRELGTRAMSPTTMYRVLQGYLEQLPRAMKKRELEDGGVESICIYTPHSIRATTATLLLDAGEDIRDVQKLLGHRHVTVTQVYDKRRRGSKDSSSHRLIL